ncbi:hypothetical protein M422DRAFT_255213 [Sphaerobolus stellatus SS14]|uniref:Uncharacterized protein n=1 Tax=Sphaerobolus stellatus (strain SS14) TaxID=990650 RepID=A0A0C9VUG5_SPHS4|nr:hypothetical protein M422DRAFT_255213 [Sphaerobolus stellatus SS14]
MPFGQQWIQHGEEQRWFVDLINTIDLPIRSVSLEERMLSWFGPAALTKLRTTTHVSVHWFDYSINPTQAKTIWHVLDVDNKGPLKELKLSWSLHTRRFTVAKTP